MNAPSIRRKRIIVRACITIGMLTLVFWTALTITGHHVSPAVCIAPVMAVACGLSYLRSTGRP